MRAERAGDPLDRAALLHKSTLGVEVVHILRPVFDGRIAQTRVFADKQLYAARVQVRHVVFRGGAAFDEVQIRALVYDDQRVLKLARARRIQAEIALQRDFHLHALGHIHKRAARPNRAVQRGKLVIRRLDQLHEVFFHHVGIWAGQRAFHVGVNDALCGDFLAHIVIDQFGVILRAHARQRFALRLRNAQPLKRVFDILRHVAPLGLHTRIRADIGDDVIHIQPFDGRAPVRHAHVLIDLQRLQAEKLHPRGIVLFSGNLLDDGRSQARAELERVFLIVFEIVDAAVNILDIGFFFVHGCSPFLNAARTQQSRSR